MTRSGPMACHWRPARIDAFQPQIRILALQAVEIPPRHAVLRGDHGRVRPEQRPHLLGRFPGLMRLQRDDDVVLRPELGRIVGGRHLATRSSPPIELQPVLLDRGEMRAARHERDVGAAPLHQHAHIAADGAGAVDANLHEILPAGLTIGASACSQPVKSR